MNLFLDQLHMQQLFPLNNSLIFSAQLLLQRRDYLVLDDASGRPWVLETSAVYLWDTSQYQYNTKVQGGGNCHACEKIAVVLHKTISSSESIFLPSFVSLFVERYDDFEPWICFHHHLNLNFNCTSSRSAVIFFLCSSHKILLCSVRFESMKIEPALFKCSRL